MFATRGLRRTGSASSPSKRSSWTPTTGRSPSAERNRAVLQAAHIPRSPGGGEHRLDNGLLLRSDVHTLFDRDTSAWTRSTACWSAAAAGDFSNGDQFYAKAGQVIDCRSTGDGRPRIPGMHLDEVSLRRPQLIKR